MACLGTVSLRTDKQQSTGTSASAPGGWTRSHQFCRIRLKISIYEQGVAFISKYDKYMLYYYFLQLSELYYAEVLAHFQLVK